MTLDDDSLPPRQRAANVDAAIRRRAKQILGPIQERIASWHERLALLRTAKMLRPELDARGQAAELLSLVVAARIELESALVDLGDEAVSRHSSIASVRASLVRLREELEELSSQ